MQLNPHFVPELLSGLCLWDCMYAVDLRYNLSEVNNAYGQRCDLSEANEVWNKQGKHAITLGMQIPVYKFISTSAL